MLIAVTDNLADSLVIHAYQESEKLAPKQAVRSTVTNFLARFVVTASFVILVLAVPAGSVAPLPEVVRHLGVASVVILASRAIGMWILARASR